MISLLEVFSLFINKTKMIYKILVNIQRNYIDLNKEALFINI